VGSYLVKQLCQSNRYARVLSFSRRPFGYDHPLLQENISDLTSIPAIASEIKGQDLFCCLGTTIKKAGSKKNFKKIDYDMPVELARIAVQNGFEHFLLVSSIGADAHASNFYLHTKGQTEQEVVQCKIPKISIVRPSMLLGPRKEFRFGEAVGKVIMKLANPLMIGKYQKYRGIHAEDVAIAMLDLASRNSEGVMILESDELQQIAKNHKMK
jgi:uncharacterized protein YbjT (DUF2867 family)